MKIMCQFVYIFLIISILFLGTFVVDSRSLKKQEDTTVFCREIPPTTLEEILGGAYNSRYMSIDTPDIEFSEPQIENDGKRGTDSDNFYINQKQVVYDEKPAWEIQNHVRNKRESVEEMFIHQNAQEWHCKSKIVWRDLGPDYFPRYLRSVECETSKSCWFNIYKCKPKSFAVKILRRRRGFCVTASPGVKIGNDGLPSELRQLWVWEEHALTFCCECSIN